MEQYQPDNFEDIFDHEDWSDRLYLSELENIEIFVKNHGAIEAATLIQLLNETTNYFERNATDKNTRIAGEIYEKFSLINASIQSDFLNDKTKTFIRAMAIGQFIDILVQNGLPRKPAIKATSEWLEIGLSTARTHNENFRKTYAYMGVKARYLSSFKPYIFERLNSLDSFPLSHPRAKNAIKETKAFYQKYKSINELFASQETVG